jgi:hypothetical protein
MCACALACQLVVGLSHSGRARCRVGTSCGTTRASSPPFASRQLLAPGLEDPLHPATRLSGNSIDLGSWGLKGGRSALLRRARPSATGDAGSPPCAARGVVPLSDTCDEALDFDGAL